MNVDLSHAGTYYCAVASCGHILFGNGTKLGFGNEVALLELKYLVYFLSGALAFATILLVLLAFSVYKMSKRNRFQSPGQKLKLISSYYTLDKNSNLHGEFKNNPRFTLDNENNKNHLTITDLHTSDSATYYCISGYLYRIEILESTTVSVTASGLNVQTLVNQSESGTIDPGGSVTLNCTVHTGTCDGEHSVYWFKHSEESHPGLIYTHGGRNDQCEKKHDRKTHTCVYNLLMNNLNLSHAGTYYCAVASCGQILFGNGTKLDFARE
ncbi:uncharacterized protein ABDE67_020601 [Symphorus nematophorus]